MRLRCQACGCYVRAFEPPDWNYWDNWTGQVLVQPCKRCLHEMQRKSWSAGHSQGFERGYFTFRI